MDLATRLIQMQQGSIQALSLKVPVGYLPIAGRLLEQPFPYLQHLDLHAEGRPTEETTVPATLRFPPLRSILSSCISLGRGCCQHILPQIHHLVLDTCRINFENLRLLLSGVSDNIQTLELRDLLIRDIFQQPDFFWYTPRLSSITITVYRGLAIRLLQHLRVRAARSLSLHSCLIRGLDVPPWLVAPLGDCTIVTGDGFGCCLEGEGGWKRTISDTPEFWRAMGCLAPALKCLNVCQEGLRGIGILGRGPFTSLMELRIHYSALPTVKPLNQQKQFPNLGRLSTSTWYSTQWPVCLQGWLQSIRGICLHCASTTLGSPASGWPRLEAFLPIRFAPLAFKTG